VVYAICVTRRERERGRERERERIGRNINCVERNRSTLTDGWERPAPHEARDDVEGEAGEGHKQVAGRQVDDQQVARTP
jgi:hypothetical protein